MKALILAGGKATRLLPLTVNTPKAMLPVLNTPFLEHVIRFLGRHEIRDIVLAVGHLAPAIKEYFGDGCLLGAKLTYLVEKTPLGTAGAIKNAQRYLDNEAFLVLNGDIFTDLDITAMIDFHRQRKAKVTIALTPVDDPTSYGLVETNAQGGITRFLEKPSWDEVTTNMINAGTYVLEPEILAQIPAETEVSIERKVFPRLLAQKEPVYAFATKGYWLDMGTPEKYLQLHRDLLGGKSPQHALAPGKKIVTGEQTKTHPTAQIKGPVVIGSNCYIGRRVKLTGPAVIGNRCTILEDTEIENSVIWHGVRLEKGVNLKNSILADGCCLNAGSTCIASVLSDNVTLPSNLKLEPGSKIWPGTALKVTG